MIIKIGEFATCTGLSKDTIRYYEKMGLLRPEINNKHREYNVDHIEISSTILKLKQCGFSLQEIKILFEWSQNTDENDELTEAEIQNLQQMKLLFQNKYKQMIQREKEIKQIKQVLQRADTKMEQLLEKNKG
ncbi:MerR family transcriptional regulator [Lysinibacillus xylanilyticus]|uniref:MerR family transcriptional regulator n=1 Tax=Lysinibacillus xylanilyticus TaxID=582475 RepID=UPI002B2540C2|nr:MerR family transcriptional regulator [Lysinibacillus xylanilyticus]MEB2300522.1 MerR family transcriptional regulator [Lysinibacillus xylanilyticus]